MQLPDRYFVNMVRADSNRSADHLANISGQLGELIELLRWRFAPSEPTEPVKSLFTYCGVPITEDEILTAVSAWFSAPERWDAFIERGRRYKQQRSARRI